MMLRRLPVLSTIVVLIAVGVMIRLGFWQLDRLQEKETAIATFSAAQSMGPAGHLDAMELESDQLGYRTATVTCERTRPEMLVAGANIKGIAGWAHAVPCLIENFEGHKQLPVIVGWSKDLRSIAWSGGEVTGTLVPGKRGGIELPEHKATFGFVQNSRYYLVADPPLPGLEANARPNPRDIPNNHLSYAVQWFLFALVALVIYALAVRKRLADEPDGR